MDKAPDKNGLYAGRLEEATRYYIHIYFKYIFISCVSPIRPSSASCGMRKSDRGNWSCVLLGSMHRTRLLAFDTVVLIWKVYATKMIELKIWQAPLSLSLSIFLLTYCNSRIFSYFERLFLQEVIEGWMKTVYN